jgi:hypothetical protein
MSRDAPLLSSLVERLRGVYRLGVNDGHGPLNGSMTFTREFQTPPIQHEAAERIEYMQLALGAAAQRFRQYEALHAAKPDPEKARRNREMAELCEDAMQIAPSSAEQTPTSVPGRT